MIIRIKIKSVYANHPKFKNIHLPEYIYMYISLDTQEYQELARLRTHAQMKVAVLKRSAACVYT